MAYCSVNLLNTLESAARQIIAGNEVGVVNFGVHYSPFMKRFEIKILHKDGYAHLLHHYDPHELIKLLGCYIHPHWRTYGLST